MKVKLKDKNKMKRYLSWKIGRKITNEEFKDCIDYFYDTAKYIYEQREGECLIQEGASLEVEIDCEDYEVWVVYNYLIENGIDYVVIDFDYNYDEFVDSLPFEIH